MREQISAEGAPPLDWDALEREIAQRRGPEAGAPEAFYGLDPLPPRGEAVSNELVDELRDDESA